MRVFQERAIVSNLNENGHFKINGSESLRAGNPGKGKERCPEEHGFSLLTGILRSVFEKWSRELLSERSVCSPFHDVA